MSADDRDDDLDGDDQLKSMRSVWVSMRESDQDPPDRGLAALMAAAREKAGELAEPPRASFWQRVLAAFRRPPVLALASVTVLLGGALFIANRRDEMKAESTVTVSREAAPVPQTVAPAPSVGSATAEAPPPANEKATLPADPHGGAPVPAEPSPPRRKPGRSNSAPAYTPKPPPPASEALKIEAEKPNRAPGLIGGADSAGPTVKDVEPTAPMPAPEAAIDKKPVTRAPTVKGEAQTVDESAVDDSRSARVSQLVKQCEVAATRGDCAAVRLLAGRIKSEDADAYAQRVQKNAAIVRCLSTVVK